MHHQIDADKLASVRADKQVTSRFTGDSADRCRFMAASQLSRLTWTLGFLSTEAVVEHA